MGFADLAKRVVVSTVLIVFLIFLLAFAFHPWLRYAVALLVTSLTCIGVWEYAQFAKAKGNLQIFPISLLLVSAGFLVLSFFLASVFPTLFSCLPVLVLVCSFFTFNAWHFRKTEGSLSDLAVCAFALLYIGVPMGMLLAILYGLEGDAGRWWIIYLVAVTKVTDVGAYFGGHLWGRKKLAVRISPGKTIEGAIAGLLTAVAVSGLLFLLQQYMGGSGLGGGRWLWMGIILGIVGQFGDLAESLLKRDAQRKDSNNLPGFGGVLDLLDSIIYNVPIVYLFVKCNLFL